MFNQIPHQLDIIRVIDGGPLESVYAMTGIWDRTRPTEGAMTALLRFKDDVAASLTYSGYDHFDTDEFHAWVGEGGNERKPQYGKLRRELRELKTPAEEARARTASGFAGKGIAKPSGTDASPALRPRRRELRKSRPAPVARRRADL